MVITRALQEQLEKTVFEQYVQGVQTRIDDQTPPEMRWLVMYPKLTGAELGPLRERFAALANAKPWLQQWIAGPLAAALAASKVAAAAPLVRLRAQAMQEAVPPGAGAMVAVLGPDGATVRDVCARVAAESGEVVAAANFNDPKQTVISGSAAGIAAAGPALKAAGAKRLMPLAVSAPFHCELMRPAAERLRAHLARVGLTTPSIDLVNNIDVAVERDPDRIRDALYRQAFGPVRWVELMQSIAARGIRHVVECGPGKVLAKMVSRIDERLVGTSVYDPGTLGQAKELLR
jgi:[acyl-carrier-protein] S-malonyltransferase